MVKTKSAGTATQATVVDETAHSAPKFTRNAPKSTINKILDFLMFFNNGKVCANTHRKIFNIKRAESQILRQF